MNEEICYPKFDPKPWDGILFEWKNKKFIKETYITQNTKGYFRHYNRYLSE